MVEGTVARECSCTQVTPTLLQDKQVADDLLVKGVLSLSVAVAIYIGIGLLSSNNS